MTDEQHHYSHIHVAQKWSELYGHSEHTGMSHCFQKEKTVHSLLQFRCIWLIYSGLMFFGTRVTKFRRYVPPKRRYPPQNKEHTEPRKIFTTMKICLHFHEMQQATLMMSECNSWQLYVKLHFPLTMVRSGDTDVQLLNFHQRIHQKLRQHSYRTAHCNY